jgi:hypothetical protein
MAAAQRVINQLPLGKAGAEERAAASRERKRGRQQELQAQQLLPLERLEYFFSKQEQQIQRRQLDASVRGKQQKQQPSWSMEAAEALCKLGMTAEQAMQALLAAHSHALRRAQREQAEELAGTSSDSGNGGKTGNGYAAASATAAAAAMGEVLPAVVPPVSPAQVEAACRELIATARVPVTRLRQVLMDSPVLLTCSPVELQKAVSDGGGEAAGKQAMQGGRVAGTAGTDDGQSPQPHSDARSCFAALLSCTHTAALLPLSKMPPLLIAAQGSRVCVAQAAPPGCQHPRVPRHAGARLSRRGAWVG